MMLPHRFEFRVFLAALGLLLLGSLFPGESPGEPATGLDIDPPASLAQFALESLSSRPDMVSGGNSLETDPKADALVEVRLPAGASPDALTVNLNGTDVTGSFSPVPGDPSRRRALLGDLAYGNNRLAASLDGHGTRILNLVGHSIEGPILSGFRQSPYACTTLLPQNGLGPALNGNCFAEPLVTYRYRSTSGNFKVLADPAGPFPADGVMTTTSDGKTVPFAVATERGVINRGIYTISTLVDVGPDFVPCRAGRGWNGKLVYFFGGGCEPGYHQGQQGGAVNANVAAGYAAAQSTLNVFGNRCSDSVSAETLSMVKEHFNESWGLIGGTIGYGGSGGSMAQQMINNNYPGLLDASILGNSFPDNAFAANSLMDCHIVDSYVDAHGWSEAERHAVKGGALEQTCDRTWDAFGGNFFGPATNCPPPAVLPVGDRYNPVTNPGGVRCVVWDGNINVWGTDPATGFARQAVDNVGVQYGLEALRSGEISWSQFIGLNQGVGSLDHDGNPVSARRAAPAEALRIAYQSGGMNEGGAGYSTVPTLDNRDFSIETEPNGHAIVHALSMRARAEAAAGGPVPQVIYTSPNGLEVTSLVPLMSQWIDAIQADESLVPDRVKALGNAPAAATDTCFDAAGNVIAFERAGFDSGTCGSTYPSHVFPRLLTGAPLANDVLKCALRPVDPDEYGSVLTPAQVTELEATFPEGVCDYSRPGVEQATSRRTWRAWPLSTAPDTVSPDTAISNAPPAAGAPATVAFGFSSTETGSSFECRLDPAAGTGWVPCGLNRVYPDLPDGLHRFEVRSVDPSGNTDPTPAAVDFQVGQPSPDATVHAARATLVRVAKRLDRRGRLRLRFRCSLTNMERCAGRVRITTTRRSLNHRLKGKRGKRTAKVGSRALSMAAGRHNLRVKLKRSAKRALGRRTLKVTVRWSVRQRSGPARKGRRTARIRRSR